MSTERTAQKGCGSASLEILRPGTDVVPSSLLDIRPTLEQEAGLRDFHRSLPTQVVLLFFPNVWVSSQSKCGESQINSHNHSPESNRTASQQPGVSPDLQKVTELVSLLSLEKG